MGSIPDDLDTIHGIGALCGFSGHLADRPRAAAILNKKCILRIGTVSICKCSNYGQEHDTNCRDCLYQKPTPIRLPMLYSF